MCIRDSHCPYLLLCLGQTLPELLCNKGHEGVQQPQTSVQTDTQRLLRSCECRGCLCICCRRRYRAETGCMRGLGMEYGRVVL